MAFVVGSSRLVFVFACVQVFIMVSGMYGSGIYFYLEVNISINWVAISSLAIFIAVKPEFLFL